MKDISVVRVDMDTCNSETLHQWANCYCEIWKEPPWNEDFWQPEGVIEDFKGLMRKSNAMAFLAIDNNVIAGFTLGYSVNREELQVIAGSNMMDSIFDRYNRIFYIAELGVAKQFRNKRISFTLTEMLIRSAQAFGLEAIILRTHMKANIARHVYEKLSFSELDVHDAKYSERTYWILEVNHE